MIGTTFYVWRVCKTHRIAFTSDSFEATQHDPHDCVLFDHPNPPSVYPDPYSLIHRSYPL